MARKGAGADTLREAVDENRVGDVRDLVATATQRQRNYALFAATCDGGSALKVEMVRILLAAGADPNYRHRLQGRRTMLHTAVGVINPTLTSLMLEAGADPNAAACNGFTPLHLAVCYVRSPDSGPRYAALDIEKARRALEMVKALLSWRADATALDECGYTALDVLDGWCRWYPGDDPVAQAIAVLLLKAGSPAPADPTPLVRAAMDALAAVQRLAAPAPAGRKRRPA